MRPGQEMLDKEAEQAFKRSSSHVSKCPTCKAAPPDRVDDEPLCEEGRELARAWTVAEDRASGRMTT